MPPRLTLIAASLLGSLGIAFGAYAAHGLTDTLAARGFEAEELAKRIANFETGVRYQMLAALFLLALGLRSQRGGWPLRAAGCAITVGALLFSTPLYALAFVGEGWRWLGAIVPLGGLTMIIAWGLIAAAAFNNPEPSQETHA
ncbi:hypothetical protein Mal64_10820 [Pseudobythopirellula maris]|uniref:DUF423 domain-containing protein n=1 Tax=Pseudobythopirellula maris TaxID=2527991 RepID=A0A5C5ZUL5_9BACT|nr:DUF423 domain-containing protein [Pseudobythopirellula maris]TWT90687.1 hypothetical protein Mal64_10820 [Pseudobythopirellula maris]